MAYLEEKFKYLSWNEVDPTDLREYTQLQKKMEQWKHIVSLHGDTQTLIEMCIEYEEDVPGSVNMDCSFMEQELQKMKLELMFNGKYDHNNAIVSLNAGAGGKEAQDWCGMLFRMYMGWANKKGFDIQLLDWQDGEDSSVLKNASLLISGENAYGLLKNEMGVHRLIRVSPFDSQNRRHTSFAAVEVMPEIEVSNGIELDMKDVRVDTFRSSGKGGQHVNTTDSAVRLTHIPTGIVAACQQERSQHQNKEVAMKMLISKLIAIKEKEHYDTLSEIQGDQARIEWGSQIRSYVFMPYQMVKDHRTNHETGNIDAVMNGDLDEFIFKSLAK